MFTFYRPQIKDQGSHIIRMTTGTLPALTPNVTNTFGIGGISDLNDNAIKQGHTAYVDEVIVGQQTLVADSDGTVLLNVIKFDASAGSTVNLVTSFDLETMTAGKSQRAPLLAAATDQQRVIDFGDYLYITIVNNSAAINTQALGLVVSVHIKLLT